MKFANAYMTVIYNNPKRYARLVRKTAQKVRALQKKLGFDALAFTGTSGAAIAYPVSVATGIHLICVRKTIRGTHCSFKVEGSDNKNIKKYLIIDDFTDSGNTIRKIIKMIRTNKLGYNDKVAECVGALMHEPRCNDFWVSGIPVYTLGTKMKNVPLKL